MSLMDMWAVCDRCSFEYKRRFMKVESTGVLVCRRCNDGKFDRIRHPQNYAAKPRREGRPVPGGTPPIDLTLILTTEDGSVLLTESGYAIEVTPEVWTPSQSVAF